MKLCPQCSFENPEEFPTCCYCNTSIVQVPSHSPLDPESAEHEKEEIRKTRAKLLRSRLQSAIVWYSLAVVFLALVNGFIFELLPLLIFALGAAFVALLVINGLIGQFTTGLVQGMVSVTIYLGVTDSFQPFVAFMLLGHICFGGVLWWWVDALQRQQM